MKRLVLATILFSALVSTCPAVTRTFVYKMICADSMFDESMDCPVKPWVVTHGFIAVSFDVDNVEALGCGEYEYSVGNAVVVKYGRVGSYLWRCWTYPDVRIYRLEPRRLCVIIETTYGYEDDCVTCIMDAVDSDAPVRDIGGGTKAVVPAAIGGTCLYNGSRIKGEGRCSLWLDLVKTRAANNIGYDPYTAINMIVNTILLKYEDLGYCCDPMIDGV